MLVTETWVVTLIIQAMGGSSGLVLDKASILRLLRLMRLTRLTRLMRAVPELLFMMKGMLEATRSVACTLALLILILYVFGITLKQLSDGTPMGKRFFGTVPDAMYTLLFNATFLDNV